MWVLVVELPFFYFVDNYYTKYCLDSSGLSKWER